MLLLVVVLSGQSFKLLRSSYTMEHASKIAGGLAVQNFVSGLFSLLLNTYSLGTAFPIWLAVAVETSSKCKQDCLMLHNEGDDG